MAQLVGVDSQNQCQFYRLKLKPLASSSLYDFYGKNPLKCESGCIKIFNFCNVIYGYSQKQ